jgi:hypothetical protein
MNMAVKWMRWLSLLAGVVAGARAQDAIPGKLYVAEIGGAVTITAGGKLADVKKGLSLTAQGARIETAAAGYAVLVYSNGTAIYLDEKTILEVDRFTQIPFPAGTDTSVNEPSVSNTLGRLAQGRLIIATNKLATGTSMVYLSPHGEVRVRGQEVVIEASDRETRVLVVAGDVTVRPRNAAAGEVGRVVLTGQMVVLGVTAADAQSIDAALVPPLTPKIEAAERARTIVRFEAVGGDIQPRVSVPTDLPVNLTVSPSTLRTGG